MQLIDLNISRINKLDATTKLLSKGRMQPPDMTNNRIANEEAGLFDLQYSKLTLGKAYCIGYLEW